MSCGPVLGQYGGTAPLSSFQPSEVSRDQTHNVKLQHGHSLPLSVHCPCLATGAATHQQLSGYKPGLDASSQLTVPWPCAHCSGHLSPEVVKVDIRLLPLGKQVLDEPLSLPRLAAGQEHLAHCVGHFWLVSG